MLDDPQREQMTALLTADAATGAERHRARS
jgi:hypothetical protein